MMRRLLSLWRDQRGAAAIEMALMSSLCLIALLPGVDFALYINQQQRIRSAVEQGAVYAYNNNSSLDTSTVQNYVQSAGGLSTGAVTITCNGTSSCSSLGSSWYCLTTTGTYTSAASQGAACASGSTAGYYLTVSASKTFNPIVIPHGILRNKSMAENATVRLR